MSSSKSQSEQKSTQQDNKVAADGGSTVVSGAGGAVTINQSDMGLISQAFDYFKNKDAYAAAATEKIIDTTSAGFKSLAQAGSSFIDKATTAADPAAQQSRLEMMMMALGAFALLMMFKGAK